MISNRYTARLGLSDDLRDNTAWPVAVGQVQLGNLESSIGERLERRFAAIKSETVLRMPFVSHLARQCEGVGS